MASDWKDHQQKRASLALIIASITRKVRQTALI
jgi:hypothetical protein